jgi:hypothetical protein
MVWLIALPILLAVAVLTIAALKGFTLGQAAWVLTDAWRDPLKWLRPRDERGRLRPSRKDGNNFG